VSSPSKQKGVDRAIMKSKDPNYGESLKFYLKELAEDKILHSPENKLVVNETGIFKIMMKKGIN
jgi:hypothetical protein